MQPNSAALDFGIIGLGAFGQFMARHLRRFGPVTIHDPSPASQEFARQHDMKVGTLAEAAARSTVVLAVPVEAIEATTKAIAPHVKPGATVLDVASVKIGPAKALHAHMPAHANIICTHPLFGPQSAKDGLKGHKIVVCAVRGDVAATIRFLAQKLELEVIEATPDAHDRDLAMVQGLTHMIAKLLVQMEPLPQHMTTRSFDLLMRAVEMVRYDSEELFMAIERANPHSQAVRKEFFALAEKLNQRLSAHD